MNTEQEVVVGDCLDLMKDIADCTIDAIVTDPPYGLSQDPDVVKVLTCWLAGNVYVHHVSGFMGKVWDSFVPGPEYWREAYRILKPGGNLFAFSGTRTFDLLSIAIRLAGFQARDSIADLMNSVGLAWVYGQGFPKSLSVEKAIEAYLVRGSSRPEDILNGVGEMEITQPEARVWAGYGTSLKPSWEPILCFRKPIENTVAENVLKYGTGGLNIDACRLQTTDNLNGGAYSEGGRGSLPGDERDPVAAGMFGEGGGRLPGQFVQSLGRWPANLILSHFSQCVPDGACATGCPVAEIDQQSGVKRAGGHPKRRGADDGSRVTYGVFGGYENTKMGVQNTVGGASRFFATFPFKYSKKASRKEREAGCDVLPARSGAEAVDREEGSAGMKSPRAGAGRTAEKVRNFQPTVKPIDVMRWLVRLAVRPGGLVLDPFAGSGTTGIACAFEGMSCLLVEREPDYAEIAKARIAYWREKIDEDREKQLTQTHFSGSLDPVG